ncbi:ATP-binding protein [Spirillospora sp. NPDC029432]|uniref:ATP-binding protein n=1 Tax=Spirillospora sp. NPDC029432 TaxID=3154599 RepID=UPI0034572F3B
MTTSPETAGLAGHAPYPPASLGEAVPLPAAPVPAAPPSGGLTWTLPAGPACAGHARSALAAALAEAGVPRAAVADAQLMVSELATNAHQHAPDHGPHELWLYAGPPGELRCAVFDRHAAARLPVYSWTSGDYGRGLSIVRELSDGRWGMLRTHSRRTPRVPGKAVWFAVPGEARPPERPG